MGCLGVHFALTKVDAAALRARKSDAARLKFLQKDLEPRYYAGAPDWFAECHRAWDAIHRALTDGDLAWDNGTFPLNHFILGGDALYEGDDYLMSLKTPAQVKKIAAALHKLRKRDFRRRYFAIDENECRYTIDDDGFASTWAWFTCVRNLYYRAAKAGRYVLFTAG